MHQPFQFKRTREAQTKESEAYDDSINEANTDGLNKGIGGKLSVVNMTDECLSDYKDSKGCDTGQHRRERDSPYLL